MATAHWKGQKGFGTRLETKGKSTLTIEGKEELKSLKLINFPYFNDTGPGSNVGTEGQAEKKPVLYFIGKAKGLVLNKTNGETLSSAYGDETDVWRESIVVLYPTTTSFKGQTVPCLRVRVPTPPAGTGNDEEPPF